MRPSIALEHHRAELLALSSRHRLAGVRVFGSVARGEDGEGSDLDLLVDAVPDVTTLFDLAALRLDAERLLGVRVDVRTVADIHETRRERVLREAVPL